MNTNTLAPKKKRGDFSTRIHGIPCQVMITQYKNIAGSYNRRASSAMKYYGYTDIQYVILDRKGYRADWLRNKMDGDDENRIEDEIEAFYDMNIED